MFVFFTYHSKIKNSKMRIFVETDQNTQIDILM